MILIKGNKFTYFFLFVKIYLYWGDIMKIYNTLTKSLEEFVPHKDGYVSFYTCGPTVYKDAHIGNLRNYIQADILQRSLEYLGYQVDRCMNITDVGHLSSDADTGDDKMVRSAKEKKKSVLDIAKYYTDLFFKDLENLNIKMPNHIYKATECIDDYIEFIKKLENDGYAYFRGGNVYFDTSKLNDYYALSNHSEEDNAVGVRDTVDEDTNKKNKSDFVLWFTKSKFDDQELKWDSPWGYGYPGWHIECSVMAKKAFGEYLDIHSGGVDLIFPHHTNEIAQSEAYFGHKWCNYWVHNEYLNDASGKMSKSNGEFLTLNVLINKGYSPMDYRYFCLGSHYRKQLVFTYDSLDMAKNALQKLKSKIALLDRTPNLKESKLDYYQNKFKDAINNDLNTSMMLTVLYDVLKDNELNDFTKLYLVDDFDKVLGLNLIEEYRDDLVDEDIEKKIIERDLAKKEKDFKKADEIRDELLALGIKLIDTREGTKYEIIK